MPLSADGSIAEDQALREETAAAFFVKLLDNPLPEVQALLDDWRAENPRNAVAYARVAAAWDIAAGLKSVAPSPEHGDHRSESSGGSFGSDQ